MACDAQKSLPFNPLEFSFATSASELAARSDVVILVLTGSPQVEAVLAGAGGVLQGLRAGSIVIDCSTAIPASTLRMAQAVEAAGSRFLDTPMTRTPKEAAEGRLNLLVGGDAALLEECRPLLKCFAENITHVGPVGAGPAPALTPIRAGADAPPAPRARGGPHDLPPLPSHKLESSSTSFALRARAFASGCATHSGSK